MNMNTSGDPAVAQAGKATSIMRGHNCHTQIRHKQTSTAAAISLSSQAPLHSLADSQLLVLLLVLLMLHQQLQAWRPWPLLALQALQLLAALLWPGLPPPALIECSPVAAQLKWCSPIHRHHCCLKGCDAAVVVGVWHWACTGMACAPMV